MEKEELEKAILKNRKIAGLSIRCLGGAALVALANLLCCGIGSAVIHVKLKILQMI